MEHRYIDGTLRHGYYCMNCGDAVSLYGHFYLFAIKRGPDPFFWKCTSNPTLVEQLKRANPPPGIKPRYIRPGVIAPVSKIKTLVDLTKTMCYLRQ